MSLRPIEILPSRGNWRAAIPHVLPFIQELLQPLLLALRLGRPSNCVGELWVGKIKLTLKLRILLCRLGLKT